MDDGCDKAEATGILFGELWFAGGQSNMELSNVFFPDREQLYEKLRGRKVRIYAQSWMGGRGGDSDFPQEPQPQLDGEWLDCTNGKALDNVSALATSAMPGIFDFLNRHQSRSLNTRRRPDRRCRDGKATPPSVKTCTRAENGSRAELGTPAAG